jgi:hypothetical protein
MVDWASESLPLAEAEQSLFPDNPNIFCNGSYFAVSQKT